MRVLWVGDSPNVSTGFARCTRAACDELHRAGHEVHILGINEFGDPSDYHSPVYPCRQPLDEGHDAFGVTRAPVLAHRLKPDVIVLLNDPWNVPEYTEYYDRFVEGVRSKDEAHADAMARTPIVGWLAVDAENQRGKPLDRLDRVVTWTRFAADELVRGGYSGDPDVVPLGVDHEVFRPVDRTEARRQTIPPGVPDDAFVVGVVGRNQPRKRVDLAIRYFATWVREREVEDAYLYLHVAPTGDRGVDLASLVRYHDVAQRVLVSEPSLGTGHPNERMPYVYGSFDVLLSTTQGEGWGLPVTEAMACGVPCVVPEWSGLADWARGAAVLVPCSSTAINAPLNGRAYTVGGVADERVTVESLERMYLSRRGVGTGGKYGWSAVRDRGLRRAREFSWVRTGRELRNVLEGVLASSAGEPRVEEVA